MCVEHELKVKAEVTEVTCLKFVLKIYVYFVSCDTPFLIAVMCNYTFYINIWTENACFLLYSFPSVTFRLLGSRLHPNGTNPFILDYSTSFLWIFLIKFQHYFFFNRLNFTWLSCALLSHLFHEAATFSNNNLQLPSVFFLWCSFLAATTNIQISKIRQRKSCSQVTLPCHCDKG